MPSCMLECGHPKKSLLLPAMFSLVRNADQLPGWKCLVAFTIPGSLHASEGWNSLQIIAKYSVLTIRDAAAGKAPQAQAG